MKKTLRKKLALSRQTIRTLDAQAMKQAAGGEWPMNESSGVLLNSWQQSCSLWKYVHPEISCG